MPQKILLLIFSLAIPFAAMATKLLTPVPFQEVKMTDNFWQPKVSILSTATLPHAFKSTQVAVDRLEVTAQYIKNGGGEKPFIHRFISSDLFKVMEGAALMLKAEPNPEIEEHMDAIIDVIGRAQAKDGYLYASHQTHNTEPGMGEQPYGYVDHSHELYNMGHLYEAAAAYYQATGKDAFLKIAEKSAQHVNRVFFIGDPNYNGGKPVNQAPGHEEIELGLLKLYRVTGNELYRDMAKRFLDIRGVTHIPKGESTNGPSYAQQHKPVAQQEKAVGHAVRACYLYAAMAEVDSVLGEQSYTEALDKIWHNIVDTKMHITGGLGAIHGIEGFGPEYDLPNEDAYNETCAAVANVFFNYRMFLKFRDAKYVDVAELSLLNNSLAGVSLDGTKFFYVNPLEVDRNFKQRSGWFGTACCPSNISRLIPQVSGYMYAFTADEIYCTLYGSSETQIALKQGTVGLVQQSGYPFDGNIKLTVNPEKKQRFTVKLRIPTWTGIQIVPGELYHYTLPSSGWKVAVNGKPAEAAVEKGFVAISRDWKKGDIIELKLPMEIKINTCIKQVKADIDRVAISRGPLIYCAESADNNGKVQRFFLQPEAIPGKATSKTIEEGLLKGITAVTVPAQELTKEGHFNNSTLTMIPYYAWANRGAGSMNVWFGTDKSFAKLEEESTYKSATASHSWDTDSPDALLMRNDPKSSADTSIRRWTSWPQKGKEQWVEIDLGKEKSVRHYGVYWYDDGHGVQVPSAWHMEARSETSDEWKKVAIYNTDSYSTLKGSYNAVQPAKKLKARYIRIVMMPQNENCALGILAVNIESD